MTSGMFYNVAGLTRELKVSLHDRGEDGSAVWRGSVGDEERFVEGDITDDIWTIFDKLVKAYESEE